MVAGVYHGSSAAAAPASSELPAPSAASSPMPSSSSSSSVSALAPTPAIFSIPTHATTHASAVDGDDDDAELGDDELCNGSEGPMTPLYGRPAPSSLLPMSFADGRETAVPPTGLEYGFPSHVLRTDLSATPGEASGWQAPTALHHADPSSLYCLPPSVSAPSHWRTAHSILAAQDKGDQHLNEGKEQYTSATMQIGGPLDEASRAAQSYQAQESPALSPPPRYRRGPFPGEQSNQFNPRAARAQPRAPRNQQHEGGRFPRWRGWLEKRAQERNGIDKGAENPEGKKTGGAPSDVRRKKSWGAAVDDDDAVSETGETVIADDTASPSRMLHMHHFGSRFISHVPSLPLCAVTLELPPLNSSTAARLLQRTIPESRKRRVLVIGTADGLYAIEVRRESGREDLDNAEEAHAGFSSSFPKSKSMHQGVWNRNIRCFQIWSGIGVYQMSLIAPQTAGEPGPRTPLYGLGHRSSSAAENGILLALCSSKLPSAKQASTFSTPSSTPFSDFPASAHTGSVLSPPAASRDSAKPTLNAANFGHDAGGGQGRPVPPSGSGGVRMWSLEAVRRMIAHVIDSDDHKPLDLLKASKVTGRSGKKTGFASRFRRAWVLLGDPSHERKPVRPQSQALSNDKSPGSASPIVDMQLTQSEEGLSRPMSRKQVLISHGRSQSENVLSHMVSAGEETLPISPEEPGNSAYHEYLRLAHSWVPISMPGVANTLGQGDSHSSLFSDDNSPSGGLHNSGTAQSPFSTSQGYPHSQGKGVLFYALAQGSSDSSNLDTWYLALAQSKSILLFESLRPVAKDAPRSWNFLKELYTPLHPKGMSFCFSEATEADDKERRSNGSHASSSLGRNASVRRGSPTRLPQAAVRSSAYSSVFRDHTSLHLFVSFGKKAVLIRASDGNVTEIGTPATSQHANMSTGASETEHGSTSRMGINDAPPPSSKSSQGHGHLHSHSLSRRSMTLDALEGGHNPREVWVGLERVHAKVVVKCLPSASQIDEFARHHYDDDDDDDDWDSDDAITPDQGGVTLRDASGARRTSLLQRRRQPHSPSHTVYASLAVLSRGTESHIFTSPVPRDLTLARALGTISWSAVPTAVHTSARVVGLERGLSSGPVPIDALGTGQKRQTSLLDSNLAGAGTSIPSANSSARTPHTSKPSRTSNDIILHVRVAALAFLPSRLELKHLHVRLPVKLPFTFARDSELELEPVSVGVSAAPAENMRSSNSQSDQSATSTSAASSTGVGVEDDGTSDDAQDAVPDCEQELEYLCGMLIGVSQEGPALRPREAADDGGAWAFDWRGANDFRIFYVGAHA